VKVRLLTVRCTTGVFLDALEMLDKHVTEQGLLLEREAPERHLCLQCAIKCNWRLLYASLLFRVVRVSFLCIFLRGWLVYSASTVQQHALI